MLIRTISLGDWNNSARIEKLNRSIERNFLESPADNAINYAPAGNLPSLLVTLSVRTSLDLYLRIKNFPKGSQIVVTAVNIPDMTKVIREHGLVPVPIDIHLDTLAADLDELEKAINSKTVAILIAHIYSRVNDIEPVIKIAREKGGIPVLEDCAEAFLGGKRFRGHPKSELVFFSFGSIKTCTSFGGAVTIVGNQSLFNQMQEAYSNYPIRPRGETFYKGMKYALVMFFMNNPFLSGRMVTLLEALGIDHREFVVAMLRGFPDKFFEKLRHRPCPALLDLMNHRFKTFNAGEEIAKNTHHCMEMAGSLPLGVAVPGLAAKFPNHWLFPCLLENPEQVIQELDRRGIDAYRGATQLRVLPAPHPTEYDSQTTYISDCLRAKFLLEKVVYLPVHKNVPMGEIHRMSKIFHQVLSDLHHSQLRSKM